MTTPRARIILDAVDATRRLSGAVVVQLAIAMAGPRKETHTAFERAIALARELVTRLEAAQTLYAATPLEEKPPVDSRAWTGRHG